MVFKNEFSWSKTRHDVFQQCPLRYYYHYYGSWNGWDARSDPRTRELYLLKKLQSRQMWMGSCVHEAIEKSLRSLRDGGLVVHFPVANQLLLARMRQDFSQSRSGLYRQRKSCALYEHEYEVQVSNDEWRQLADTASLCLQNFYESRFYGVAEKLKADEWLEVEEFSAFYLDGVKIHVVLDFSYRSGDRVYLVDWKTGAMDSADSELQLACYRLYALEKWQVPPAKVEAIEFRLRTKQEIHHHLTGLNLEEAMAEIRRSFNAMRELLEDTDRNLASEDHFAPTTERHRCSACNFKKACRAWM